MTSILYTGTSLRREVADALTPDIRLAHAPVLRTRLMGLGEDARLRAILAKPHQPLAVALYSRHAARALSTAPALLQAIAHVYCVGERTKHTLLELVPWLDARRVSTPSEEAQHFEGLAVHIAAHCHGVGDLVALGLRGKERPLAERLARRLPTLRVHHVDAYETSPREDVDAALRGALRELTSPWFIALASPRAVMACAPSMASMRAAGGDVYVCAIGPSTARAVRTAELGEPWMISSRPDLRIFFEEIHALAATL